MASPSDQILDALKTRAAPDGGWSGPALRSVLGLSVGAFAGGLLQLRRQGLVHPERIVLPAAVEVEPAEPEAVTVADAVRAEAEARGSNRKAARSQSTVNARSGTVDVAVTRAVEGESFYAAGLSLGGQMQAAGLHDNVLEAASIVRTRWNAVWKRVCLHAGMTGDRPIPAMIDLLQQALDGADVPEGDATGFRRAADIGPNNRPTAMQGRGA